MNYLLDTHALIWATLDTGMLGKSARGLILAPGNEIQVSIVSFWEISLKYSTGRLDLRGMKPDDFSRTSSEMGFPIMGLQAETVASSYNLPRLHNKDPFDRLIAWEAIKSKIVLISNDKAFDDYRRFGLQRVW